MSPLRPAWPFCLLVCYTPLAYASVACIGFCSWLARCYAAKSAPQHSTAGWQRRQRSAAQPQHTAPEHAAPPPAAQQPSPCKHGPAPLYRPVGGLLDLFTRGLGPERHGNIDGHQDAAQSTRPLQSTNTHGVFTSTDELPTTGHRGARKAAVG